MTFDATPPFGRVCPFLAVRMCSGLLTRPRALSRPRCGFFLPFDFPKNAPPSFPNRRVHSRVSASLRALRRSAATPPGCSDLVVSHHPAGLLLDNPVRTVAAAHDPGVHPRFIPPFDATRSRGASGRESPGCLSALRSLPSADGRRARCRNPRCHQRASPHLCGEDCSSCPAVTPSAAAARRRPLSGPTAASSLEAAESGSDKEPRYRIRRVHTRREFTNRLATPSFRPAGKLPSRLPIDLVALLHLRVRCATAVSSRRARCSPGLGLFCPDSGWTPAPRRVRCSAPVCVRTQPSRRVCTSKNESFDPTFRSEHRLSPVSQPMVASAVPTLANDTTPSIRMSSRRSFSRDFENLATHTRVSSSKALKSWAITFPCV